MSASKAPTEPTCETCGRKPLKGLAGPECESCISTQEAHQVKNAPDRRPAVRLRCELAHDRRYGLDFDQIWQAALDLALRDLGGRERDSWRAALMATKSAWRAGYERQAVAGGLNVDLLV